MAKYRVTELSFIDNALRQPGDIVDFDGKPAGNLEPIEDEKPKRKAKAEADPEPAADPELA